MADRLAGKVALITGGASGLGANAAILMAQEGARVVVADIAADRGKAVAARLGSAGHFVKLDVTSEDAWKAAIDATITHFGALHVLLNSAGIGLSKTVEDITLEEWRRVHAINMAAYNSAKAGVRLLSKSVALHCAKSGYNIRCNSVHPTFIDTPILDRYRDRFGNEVMQQKLGRQVPLGRLGRPEEVGWALVFLASDESSFMTGSEVVIDGGLSAM
jgi:NAD(P)-dependent dehydrogenase (short-subunit alcohol dehydrogenase family)